MTWTNNYVGIPFLNLGRTREGVDCWGLVKLIMREQFNLELSDFKYADAGNRIESERLFANADELQNWYQVTEPLIGDLVALRIFGNVCHFGICAGSRYFLHSLYGLDSALDSLDSARWNRRIYAIYRHRGLYGK